MGITRPRCPFLHASRWRVGILHSTVHTGVGTRAQLINGVWTQICGAFPRETEPDLAKRGARSKSGPVIFLVRERIRTYSPHPVLPLVFAAR